MQLSEDSSCTDSYLANYLERLPAWELEDGYLIRKITFPSFRDAMEYVQQVGVLAEQEDLYPRIVINYREVILAFPQGLHNNGNANKWLESCIAFAEMVNRLAGA